MVEGVDLQHRVTLFAMKVYHSLYSVTSSTCHAVSLGCGVQACLMLLFYYVHSTGGWTYYFCFSVITWFPVISRKGIYPIFTKFGMGVYWVNSLHGIAFGEDSCIAN